MLTIINEINSTFVEGFNIKKIVDLDAKEIRLVTMQKGDDFPKHDSKTDVTLIVLSGHIGFFINDEEHKLSEHQIFQFPKSQMHHVKAYEKSKFLLIK